VPSSKSRPLRGVIALRAGAIEQGPGGGERGDLEGGTSGLVGLRLGAEIFHVLGLHAGEVELAGGRVGAEEDGHLDHVFHVEALVLEGFLDLGEDAGGLGLGVAVDGGGVFGGVGWSDGGGELAAEVVGIAGPDAGGDGGFVGLDVFDGGLGLECAGGEEGCGEECFQVGHRNS